MVLMTILRNLSFFLVYIYRSTRVCTFIYCLAICVGQQLLQRRLDLDLLLRKERIETALTKAADLPEGDWSARPSRIPRISGEALIRDLMALMRKHTEVSISS